MAGGDDSVPPCAVNSRLWHPGAKSSRFPSRSQRAAEAKDQEATRAATTKLSPIAFGGLLPVIVWGAETRARQVVKMRWGFADPRDWRRPRPIHARSETIDAKEPFRTPFHAGQRGIVVFRTFNEGEEAVKPSVRTETRQWTVDPKDGQPRGFAFVWRRFEISDLPAPMLACVQATVPANELIRRTVKSQEGDPRMPAILEDDAWSTWLGEGDATPATAKAVLRTMEGVNWQTAPEPKRPRPRKP
jgi:putative SOS response-associated peptidase YedK